MSFCISKVGPQPCLFFIAQLHYTFTNTCISQHSIGCFVRIKDIYPEHYMEKAPKDYSSISPSAKSLLMMKGYTQIPYAHQTARLMHGPEIFNLSFDDKDFGFWARVVHFEARYWSIDQLLKETTATNILELSSGFSLRGLDMCKKSKVHYIDTDLPEIITTKKHMIEEMDIEDGMIGKLELLPLNALDEKAFLGITERFDNTPLTIVNEGLLMYLGIEEKKQLCASIHRVLKQRGGQWITADIYIKRPTELQNVLPQSKQEAEFFEQHKIEENKFDSYEAAKTFFEDAGFEFLKEAVIDYSQLSATPHLISTLPPEARGQKGGPPKIQATWMLRAV